MFWKGRTAIEGVLGSASASTSQRVQGFFRRRASVRSSSVPVRRLKPTTAAAKIAASLPVSHIPSRSVARDPHTSTLENAGILWSQFVNWPRLHRVAAESQVYGNSRSDAGTNFVSAAG